MELADNCAAFPTMCKSPAQPFTGNLKGQVLITRPVDTGSAHPLANGSSSDLGHLIQVIQAVEEAKSKERILPPRFTGRETRMSKTELIFARLLYQFIAYLNSDYGGPDPKRRTGLESQDKENFYEKWLHEEYVGKRTAFFTGILVSPFLVPLVIWTVAGVSAFVYFNFF